jgi:oxidase EvaA
MYNPIGFLKSYSVKTGVNTVDDIRKWLEITKNNTHLIIELIKFAELKNWYFDEVTGNLRHESGKFFSIEGINVKTNYRLMPEWDQPIINQPEIGILGIIAKEINGVLHFLMQAKIEPGNINYVQISPTLQATKSNYTQVHKGVKPKYLEYFVGAKRDQILLDQLQSEQGARFLRKRNRNIIIKINEEIPVYEEFKWMTLGQIVHLMQENNTVNMDTRTILSGISLGSFAPEVINTLNILQDMKRSAGYGHDFLTSAYTTESINELDEILSWLSNLKSQYELSISSKPLKTLNDWKQNEYEIAHKDEKYFTVVAVKVHIASREVKEWTQPIIKPKQEGLLAFLVKKINGVLHFIVQAKLECGNFDVLELAPTVQCLTGNYKETEKNTLPFLDYVLAAKKEQIIYDIYQSEEGGRFYHEQNRNLIIKTEDDFEETLPVNYTWMTLNQIKLFLKFNNYLNIQARSLVAMINYFDDADN